MEKESEFGVRVNGQELTGFAKWAVLAALVVVLAFGAATLLTGLVTILRWLL